VHLGHVRETPVAMLPEEQVDRAEVRTNPAPNVSMIPGFGFRVSGFRFRVSGFDHSEARTNLGFRI
jgi:hypothetical protein